MIQQTLRFGRWGALALVLGLAGCAGGGADTPSSMGSMSAALTSVSSTGVTYRLRNAEFYISGPQSMMVYSEDFLDQSSLTLTLMPGYYDVELMPTWSLERLETDGTYTPVTNAVLLSPNMQGLNVIDGAVATLAYNFNADDSTVPFGTDNLQIGFDVDESPLCYGPPPGFLEVFYSGYMLPYDIAGLYVEAFDCAPHEGGANFGGVDTNHCFRKDDGSAWRAWNTGCGWEFGRVEPDPYDPAFDIWLRYARTYEGLCASIPPEQLGPEALNSFNLFDDYGSVIPDLSSHICF